MKDFAKRLVDTIEEERLEVRRARILNQHSGHARLLIPAHQAGMARNLAPDTVLPFLNEVGLRIKTTSGSLIL